MSTPICDPQLLVRPATSGEALAALDEAQHQTVAAEVAQVVAICHLADLWKIDQTVVAEGMERLIQAGHDGTPKVGEFVALEVGALLGLSPSSALSQIGEALDLRARHPKLWQKVIAGQARVWQARKVCSECAHLPLDTALKVDEAVAAGIDQLPFNRVLKALPGQIVAADTDLARERAEAQRASRRIRVSKIQDGSVSIFGIVDPADGINFDRLLTDLAAGLPVEPDRALCTDLDRRRNAAFSMIVRDAWARAHGEQPVFELHGGELLPLPPGRVVGLIADSPVPETAAPSWIRNDGTILAGPRIGLLERVKKTRAFDVPIVEPDGCVKVLAGHLPEASGPLLYDTPVAGDLEGIAGPAMPLIQTLVVHVSADDPAFATVGPAAGRTGVARIEGWGPLLSEQLPAFLAGSNVIVKPIVDPAGMRPVDCYETPTKMRFAIEQRNPVDVFPFGATPASDCDMDHTIAFVAGRAGQTCLGNLGPLSRKTHRAKTHGKWKLEQPAPGVFHWTSPHGYRYRVTAAGTTRIAVPAGP